MDLWKIEKPHFLKFLITNDVDLLFVLLYNHVLRSHYTVRADLSYIACVAWRFCRAGRTSGEAARKIKPAVFQLLPPQSPRGFSGLARLYHLATKTAMLRRLCLTCKGNPSHQDDYWDARQGNAQSRITFHLCREKTKWRTKLPEGFTCPIPPSMELILRGGNGSCQVVWRTHLEVDLKRTQNYWAELLALYYIHAIRLSKYGIRMRKLTCARWSCKNNTLPRFPGEMLQLVAILSLRVKSLSFLYWNFR